MLIYTYNGNIKTLQCYGLTTSTTYGLIDNLTAEYTGNQLKYVSDAVNNFALSTLLDFKEYTKGTNSEYTYNKNGAMAHDLNKGISQIQYNYLNLPQIVDIKNQSVEGRNEYTYSASGQKLKVVQKWNPNYNNSSVIGSAVNTSLLTQATTTDYVGNIIYENGLLKRILVEGGYYEGGNYYFYIRDHLGNNRIVANAAASVVQSTQYYPFGMPFADAMGQNLQPYKYNDKELDTRNGLNMYDYSARYMDFAFPHFPTADPLAEKYYSISPYVYCANNPIKFIDPDGRDGRLTGNGTEEDPYVIEAVYFYEKGDLTDDQLRGFNQALAKYNNRSRAHRINNENGTRSYIRFELSAQEVGNAGSAVTSLIYTTDENGEPISYGNRLEISSNPDGSGDEYGSANGWKVCLNQDKLKEGVTSYGMNMRSAIEGTSIHEIGHNLGLGHNDQTNIMQGMEITARTSTIGGGTPIYSVSYPRFDNRGAKIILDRVNKPRVGTLGIVRK